MKATHVEKLNKVINRVKFLNQAKQKAYIYHGSTNTTRAFNFHKDTIIDLSEFNEILEINTEEKYIVCEPNVPMDQLVDRVLPYNLTPAVVMGFPGITVGGGIAGGAGESSSFKYGLFHHTVLECEVVLGNGDCLTVSREQNSDLFWGLASTLGSLAIITKIKLKVVEAKKYIKINYFPVYSYIEFINKATELTNNYKIDFVDGIMFSKSLGVVITGEFENDIKNTGKKTSFGKFWNEWFYLHAQKRTEQNYTGSDYVLTKEYYFRYDRGAFWMGRYYFLLFKIPFNRLTRFIYSNWLHTRNLYRALHAGNMSQKYIIQDLSVPLEKALDLLNFSEENLNIYPLWLWPIKPSNQTDNMTQNNLNCKLVINLGIWGTNKEIEKNYIKLNRDLEKFLIQSGGRKMFYAHSYYTEEEFWQIYNKEWYDNLRKKYSAELLFPGVFEKLHVKEKYKPQIFKGFLKFLLNKKLHINS